MGEKKSYAFKSCMCEVEYFAIFTQSEVSYVNAILSCGWDTNSQVSLL